MAAPPLEIIICHHAGDPGCRPFVESLVRCVRGGNDLGGGYLAGGEDLLQVELREFDCLPSPKPAPAALLDAPLHTLMVVLADDAMAADPQYLTWIAECSRIVDSSAGRHGLLIVPMYERVGQRIRQQEPSLGVFQEVDLASLGEEPIRPGILSIIALHQARLLLAGPLSGAPSKLGMFLSHAKMDGQPIARALEGLIGRIPGLSAFYDATHITPGMNWRSVLRASVQDSLLVVFRTDSYETRHWCQQEVAWADEYASLIVVVDLRCRLIHPPSTLSLEGAPTLRIPDGNLLRIAFVSIRESLRALALRRSVEDLFHGRQGVDVQLLPRRPSMRALMHAARELSTRAGPHRIIVYPDPSLAFGELEAAEALLSSESMAVELHTPTSLIASGHV